MATTTKATKTTKTTKTAKTKPAALTAEQREEAERIEAILAKRAAGEIRAIARLIAGKPTERLFGETEYEIRDLLHRIGNAALATALEERKKGATEDPPPAAPSAKPSVNSPAIDRAAC